MFQTETVFEKFRFAVYIFHNHLETSRQQKISFQLDSFVESAPVPIFTGESHLL